VSSDSGAARQACFLFSRRFACFQAAAVIGSLFKIRVPGVSGSASVSALFVLIGIVDLSRPEALVIGTVSMLIQCTWRTQHRPKTVQVSFSVCTLLTAIYLSALVYDYRRPRTFELVSLAVLTLVYFFTNTFPVASIISLTDRNGSALS
jgi:hypothetical protein